MSGVARLDEIEARHGDWYGDTRAGEWSDLHGEWTDMRSDTVEQQVQARQIVRNDVPALVAALRAVLALATEGDRLGYYIAPDEIRSAIFFQLGGDE